MPTVNFEMLKESVRIMGYRDFFNEMDYRSRPTEIKKECLGLVFRWIKAHITHEMLIEIEDYRRNASNCAEIEWALDLLYELRHRDSPPENADELDIDNADLAYVFPTIIARFAGKSRDFLGKSPEWRRYLARRGVKKKAKCRLL